MSRLVAARAAARLRREPGVEVATEDGKYGELTVLVDGAVVARTGPTGWPPRVGTILAAVRAAPDRGDAPLGPA